MKVTLKHQLGFIGIYIEQYNNYAWQDRIATLFEHAFAGTPAPNKTSITHQIILSPYQNRPSNTLGLCAPASGIYNKKTIDNPRTQTAWQFDSPSVLHIWTDDPDFCIPFALQQVMQSNQASMIHAAAISVYGKTLLLPAFGGIGKTTLLASLQSNPAVKILGDDLLGLTGDGMVIPYHRPLCLYDYHTPLFTKYFKNNLFPIRINRWRLSYLVIRRLLLTIGIDITPYFTIAPVLRVPLNKVFTHSQLEHTEQPIHSIVIMQRSNTVTEPTLTNVSVDDAVTFMSNVIVHELSRSLRTMILQANGNNLPLSKVIKKTEATIANACQRYQFHVTKMLIPAELKPEQFIQKVVPLILDQADKPTLRDQIHEQRIASHHHI